MAPSCMIYLFYCYFFHYTLYEVLVATKWVWLDEIVGHLKEEKEEEPEGEVLGESNTGSLLLPPLFSL